MSLPRRSWPVLVAVAATALISYGLAAPAADRPQAAQQPTVTITLSNSAVTVSPDRVQVRRGPNSQIRWEGNAPFALVVNGQGRAFPGTSATGMRGRAGAPLTVPVRGNSTQGQYKYSVVVYNAQTGQQEVVDPEIVILP